MAGLAEDVLGLGSAQIGERVGRVDGQDWLLRLGELRGERKSRRSMTLSATSSSVTL
jgi:hypothetical protein